METLELIIMVSFHFLRLIAVVLAAVLIRPTSARIALSLGLFLLFVAGLGSSIFFRLFFESWLAGESWIISLVVLLRSLSQVLGWSMILFGLFRLKSPPPKSEGSDY